MPSYFYRARDLSGRPHEGVEVASSEDELLRTLTQMQLTPVLIEPRATAPAVRPAASEKGSRPDPSAWFRPKVTTSAVTLFARQLSTMLLAGLPLVRALRSIARDHSDPVLQQVLQQVGDDVERGESLSGALGRHPAAFNAVFVSLVETGEVTGSLDAVLEHTASYLERAEILRLKVEASLRYPLFILTFAGGILLAMFLKIIPMFADIYARFHVQLPGPTRMLLAVSQGLSKHLLLVLLLAVAGSLAFRSWRRTDDGRTRFDAMLFRIPLFGDLIHLYVMTRVARTLGILVASGTNILFALRVLRPVPGNHFVAKGIDDVRTAIEGGESLSRAMAATKVFPDMLIQMTATGEETGRLDEMLTRTADFYEKRVTAKVEGLSSLVEPVAILLLGLVIALMLVALYLPIFNLGHAMRSGMLGS